MRGHKDRVPAGSHIILRSTKWCRFDS
jgi:hypothetical protein